MQKMSTPVPQKTKAVKRRREALTTLLFWSPFDDTSNSGLTSKEQAQKVALLLAEKGLEVKVINKITADLEDLRLVVKHRVISTPCTVIRRKGGKEVYRKAGLASAATIVRALRFLHRYFIL